MAKYDVECGRCGKTLVVQLLGPHRDRQWRLDNWTWTCEECKEALKLEASENAARKAEEVGLPELEGTEKQVRWAEVLRLAKLKEFEEVEAQGMLRPRAGQERTAKEVLIQIKSNKSAKFWIDHREMGPIMILKEHLRSCKPEAERELERDVAAEATVRPETVISETVAEIRPLEDRIEVYFPERRDDFRELIKKALRYTWVEKCWVRKTSIYTGPVADRSAEVGNRILAAGFPIRIFDETIRQRAVEGDYEPECDRWIARKVEGQFADWFSIRWWSGDFYKEAKRLPGSRYSKPEIIVPAEHFEEVGDFAQVHGFYLTPGAVRLVEETRAAREKAATVAVRPGSNAGASKKSERPVLDETAAQEIPDEFKD